MTSTTKEISAATILAICISCATQQPPVPTTAQPAKATRAAPLIGSYNKAMIISPPSTLALDTFYKKYSDAFGIPIVSSEKVPDDALLVARDIVNYMLVKRMDVRNALIARKARVLIMAESEMETVLPERRDWK